MGFGLLLIGYFTATMMAFNIFGSFFKLVGYAIAFVGIKKLSSYHKSFVILLFSCVLMIAISVIGAVENLSEFLYSNMIMDERIISTETSDAVYYLRYSLECLFTIIMCISVSAISKETGAPKLVYVSIRNLVIYAIYFVLQIVCWIPIESVKSFLQATALPAWVIIFNIAIVILNLLMLFSCYSKICDESDIEMCQKPSRFEFINRMRAKKEEKERQRREKFAKKYSEKSLEAEIYSDEQQKRSAATAKKKKKNR